MDIDPLFVDDPLQVYLGEVNKIPPMSPVEELDCVQHVLAGDGLAESARERLAEANLLLVVSIAERYRSGHIHILDLIQRGNEGLLRAVQTLNSSTYVSFSGHAAACIERAIVDAIASSGSASV